MISANIKLLLNSKHKSDKFKLGILNAVGNKYIYHTSVYYLHILLSHANTNNYNIVGVTSLGVKVGKSIVNKYLKMLKNNHGSNLKT